MDSHGNLHRYSNSVAGSLTTAPCNKIYVPSVKMLESRSMTWSGQSSHNGWHIVLSYGVHLNFSRCLTHSVSFWSGTTKTTTRSWFESSSLMQWSGNLLNSWSLYWRFVFVLGLLVNALILILDLSACRCYDHSVKVQGSSHSSWSPNVQWHDWQAW